MDGLCLCPGVRLRLHPVAVARRPAAVGHAFVRSAARAAAVDALVRVVFEPGAVDAAVVAQRAGARVVVAEPVESLAVGWAVVQRDLAALLSGPAARLERAARRPDGLPLCALLSAAGPPRVVAAAQ